MGRDSALRPIPIGVDDFKKMRDGGYFYVDKTMLIADVLSSGSEVQLFTRPRRFGKSLSLSMLDAYLNLEFGGGEQMVRRAKYRGFSLPIPNREMYQVFYRTMMSHLRSTSTLQFGRLFDALETGDALGVEKNLYSILSENFKSMQLKDEGDYHLIVAAGAMSRLGRYKISVEEETGNGRTDMIFVPNYPGLPNIVVEFKRTASEDPRAWEKEAAEGLEQMRRKECFHGLKERTLLYGACFRNKKAKALMEMTLRSNQ